MDMITDIKISRTVRRKVKYHRKLEIDIIQIPILLIPKEGRIYRIKIPINDIRKRQTLFSQFQMFIKKTVEYFHGQ